MKVLDTSRSPFQGATEEGPTGAAQRANKSPGRRVAGTADWAPVFIGAIMEGAHVRRAAQLAGVDASVPYYRRKTDEVFRRAWNEAVDIGTWQLEQEAQRRAYHGTLKPVFHEGVECGAIREYSDTLLVFLLKARRPKVYRDGWEDGARGNYTININVEPVRSRQAPDDEHTPLPLPSTVEQFPTAEIETAVQSNT